MLVSAENFHIFVLIFSSFSLSLPRVLCFAAMHKKKEGNEQFLPLKTWAEDGLICILQTFFCLLSRFSRSPSPVSRNAPLASPCHGKNSMMMMMIGVDGREWKKKRLKLATQRDARRVYVQANFSRRSNRNQDINSNAVVGVINCHNFQDRSRQRSARLRQILETLIGLEAAQKSPTN